MLFDKIKQAAKNNQYLFLEKTIKLETFGLNFNFDNMLALWANNNALEFGNTLNPFLGQIKSINKIPIFKPYLSYVNNNLKDIFNVGSLDFFYSLKGEVGPSHFDKEHVIILGIKNITYYHIDNQDFKLEPGDILYIPKNFLHHAFSSRERIVLSLSIWEK